MDLSSLGQLQSLCWKAPSIGHLETLSDAIKGNSERLQKLELDFVDWQRVRNLDFPYTEEEDDAQYFCAVDVFGLTTGMQPPQPIFPTIRELSLTQVPVVAEMARAINFDTLTSLTLRRCPGWDKLLASVTELGLPIRLRKLEIYDCNNAPGGWGHETLGDFVGAFDGLEELFITEPGPEYTLELWDRVTRHQATLRKFVYHQRMVDLDDSPDYEKLQDNPYVLALVPGELRRMKEDPSQNPLATLDLDFLGLCCLPERLV